MNRESNSPDIQTLLDNTQFPSMQVDSGRVLDGGRRRVRRRRAQVAGVALAALLVVAPSGWLVIRSAERTGPVPAGQSHASKPQAAGLFGRTGGTGNLGDGRVSLYPPTTNSTNAGNPSTYQVSRTTSGLRIALVKGDVTVNLPQTGGGSSGLFLSANGSRTVLAVEVPADTTWAQPLFAHDDGGGSVDAVGSTLRDGTPVVLIETEKLLKHTARAVLWRRADGSIGATNGERPAVLTQDHDTFYYFGKLGAFGIFSAGGGSDLIPARGLAVGTSTDGTSQQVNLVIAGLYPRGVSNVRLSPAVPGAKVAVAHLPGTTWDLVTARYRATTNAKTPSVLSSYGTWDPSAGEPPATPPVN